MPMMMPKMKMIINGFPEGAGSAVEGAASAVADAAQRCAAAEAVSQLPIRCSVSITFCASGFFPFH